MIFRWKDVKAFLDNTKGYGLIFELEKIGTDKNKEKIHRELEEKFRYLGVKITPRKIFEKKFEYYSVHWRKILK